ncbi:Ubiquitin-conjugating enzyme/RWD-like protein [Metarhizium rileyi]|uniref:Ubiquitin-conjugating enzyme/RWD-like protein n=1 Tax=Metarhizium rileyi (strain RCEF 4871) TaxID=1649241 RepID=A0A162KD00_METRR|nr:Ubiquitin-conjugating enzyme/RWD-like protein [Metarhizium rileyi RCEF 4871]
MGREDQVEEREVLESIFPEEITDLSEAEFQVSIKLDILDEEDQEAPSFILQVRYPEEYPDVAPHLDLLAAQNAPSHQHFSIGDDREQLLERIQETIQENIGMAMVFTIVSALKEAAEQLIQDRKDSVARIQEEALLAAEREENKKFHGTQVTPETFLKWREGFIKEMEERERLEEEERLAELKRAKIKEPVKLTGKQLWQRGLAGNGDEEIEEDDVPTDGVEKLAVEA